MNYYDESAKKRHKKIDVENIDIKEECGDKNCADGNTPGDINFKVEGCSGKKCKKDVDFETESAKSKKKKTKKDCCGSDECTDTECKKNKKSKKDDDSVDFETESCKSKKSKKADIDFETEGCSGKKCKKDLVDFNQESATDCDSTFNIDDLPKDYKDWLDGVEAAFIKKHHDVNGDTIRLHNEDKIKSVFKRDCKIRENGTDDEKENHYSDEYVAVAESVSGDAYLLKTSKSSAVYKWDHETGKCKKIESSWSKFIDSFDDGDDNDKSSTVTTESYKSKKKDVDFETESAKSKKGKKKCTGDENCTCPDCMKKKKAGDVEIENECGDSVNFKTEACKSKKKKDADVDFETESAKCKGKKCKKNQELEIDEENLNDTKKKKKALFDQECGDTPIPKNSKFIKEEDDADLGIDPADADINVDNISLEYMVSSLDNAAIDSLDAERQVMTAMAEELYKEYLMIDYNLSDDCYAEYATEEDSDDEEVVQERFFGGTGKSAADLAKPVVKGAKRLNDIKHGVGRHGIIRNVVHRTKKDLHEGGTVYKLLTWPFLLLKNTVQTVYHKTKSFITYKGLLLGVEVKINREIKKLRKNFRNIPKAALAGGIGYATTTLNSMAKGEGAQLDPLEFIAHEGSNLIAELGHDTMLRALTNKLADAVENSPEKIREVIANRNKGTKEKLTPSDGENASTILSIKDNKITAEHLVNLVGINGMIDDIDRWSDICENVARDVSNGNDGNISGYLTQAKSIQDKYMDNDKVNYNIIYSKNSASVKISDFYAEFADKLVDKAKSLEKGLDKISGLENVIKDSEGKLSETTEKTLAELNVVMQHTCNAFMEIIGTLDDLGKYVANTMNQYLNCLTAANSIKANKNANNNEE